MKPFLLGAITGALFVTTVVCLTLGQVSDAARRAERLLLVCCPSVAVTGADQ